MQNLKSLHPIHSSVSLQLVTTAGIFKILVQVALATPLTWPVGPPSDTAIRSFMFMPAQTNTITHVDLHVRGKYACPSTYARPHALCPMLRPGHPCARHDLHHLGDASLAIQHAPNKT